MKKEHPGPDWENPAWNSDTEALVACLWRLIQIHRAGRAPSLRSPEASASGFCAPTSDPIAPEGAGE